MVRWTALTLLLVAVVGMALADDPCSGENGTADLCAFRGLLENTMLRVDQALASSDMDKRKSSYVRFGRSSGGVEFDGPEKRKSSYVRFGRAGPTAELDLEKRKSALVRFGRSDGQEQVDKRKSSYIRFG